MHVHEATDVNDSEVLGKLRGRSEDGVRQLLRDYGPKVMWLLKNRFGYILPDPDLEAVLNEATFKVFRSIRMFDASKGSLGGWYWRIAANTARDLLRDQMGRPHVSLTSDPSWQDRVPACLEDEEASRLTRTLKDLHAVIERLPDLQRKVIQADLDSGDVADAKWLASKFSTTEASIYMSRSKARQNLRLAMIDRGYFQD
jgi:RNA polymerase sigma factor (sigma-70 family)